MRWLSNMISSSSSSSSDDTSSPTKKHGKSSNILGFRVSVGGSGGKSKLTRQSEIRYLTDQDVVRTAAAAAASTATTSSRANDVALSRSQSSSSTPAPTSRSSSSVAVPLPLPLPVPDHSSSSECDARLPSPRERDRIGDDAVTEAVSSSASPISSACVGWETKRTTTEHLDTRLLPSSKVVRQDLSSADNSKDKFRVYVPARSAPTSPFGSPVPSPQTRSNIGGADLFPYYNIFPKGNQGWSAPEMPILDVPGISPPAFFDCTAYSTDNSPLHSSPSRSPPRSTRSSNGPASPAHARLSIDACTARRDSNASHEGHPLPLPPGAAMSLPSSHIAQPMAKPEPTPMKCQWQKGKLIGRGTFGSVYIATNRETGALCAMKEVELFPDDPKSAESIKQLEQEIKVLSQLKHPNIVQYYGSEIVEDRFFIYLEYVYPGSINRYVHEHCGAITESVVRSFTRHILSGLAYLHGTKTIHRDIKGANLLVDASGTVKLADFGMAKHLTGQAADLSLKGSPYWMAPELMQAVMQKDASSDLALAVDIWSLGCTIIEMFTGKPPWSEFEGAAAMFKVMRDTPPIPEKLSPEGKEFLRCCFRRNPAERPSASILLEHRWMKNSQPFEVPASNQSVNGMKSMDVVLSPRASDVKRDQLAMFSSSQRSKGKVAFESFMHYSGSPARLAPEAVMKLPT